MSRICTMRMLTNAGDITIGWTDDQASLMEEVITKKLAEGYSFFIVENDGKEVRLKTRTQLANTRSVVIGDKDAEQLIRNGKIGIVDVTRDDDDIITVGVATRPSQVASNNTVMTSPKRGG